MFNNYWAKMDWKNNVHKYTVLLTGNMTSAQRLSIETQSVSLTTNERLQQLNIRPWQSKLIATYLLVECGYL